MYVETRRFEDVTALREASLDTDWLNEMSYEVLKVSRLRGLKRARFIRALAATALAFACLCALELTRLI